MRSAQLDQITSRQSSPAKGQHHGMAWQTDRHAGDSMEERRLLTTQAARAPELKPAAYEISHNTTCHYSTEHAAPLQRLMDSASFPMPPARLATPCIHACMHPSL